MEIEGDREWEREIEYIGKKKERKPGINSEREIGWEKECQKGRN